MGQFIFWIIMFAVGGLWTAYASLRMTDSWNKLHKQNIESRAEINAAVSGNNNIFANRDVVISQYQSGGQTAHTIINIEKPKRSIKGFEDQVLMELKKHPRAAYRFCYNSNYAEVNDLVKELDNVFIQAGWQKLNPLQRLSGPPFPEGITIQFVKQNETNTALVAELMKIPGLKVEANYVEGVKDVLNIPGIAKDYQPIEGVSDILIIVGPSI